MRGRNTFNKLWKPCLIGSCKQISLSKWRSDKGARRGEQLSYRPPGSDTASTSQLNSSVGNLLCSREPFRCNNLKLLTTLFVSLRHFRSCLSFVRSLGKSLLNYRGSHVFYQDSISLSLSPPSPKTTVTTLMIVHLSY